jgi:hypothetical protein
MVLVLVASLPAHARQAGGRWYDSYNEGIKAIQRGDWVTAEQRLLDARSSGPKSGRRVFVYGDTYMAFLPDYYLGVVYLNSGRPREAEAAFAQVRSQGLIGARDPEYAQFQAQSLRAAADRAAAETKAMASNAGSKPVPPPEAPVQSPVQTSPPTSYAPPAVAPSADVAKGDLPVASPPTMQGPVTAGPGPSPVFPKAASAAIVVPPRIPLPPPPAPVPAEAMQNGLVAFFSGDYRTSVMYLEIAARQAGASPRVRLFLACARASLVLTGGGDLELLRTARADYRGADPQRNLTDAQRRLISPRVLEQLERP